MVKTLSWHMVITHLAVCLTQADMYVSLYACELIMW